MLNHDATAPTRTVEVVDDDIRPNVPAPIDALFLAVVEATEEAVLNSLFRAETVVGRDGHRREALPVDPVVALLRQAGRLRA